MNQATIKGYLSDIKSHLPTLLHPLSHYSAQTPVYKNELIEVINRVRLLDNTLSAFDYDNISVLKEKNLPFVLNIKGSSGWDFHYQFNLCQNLYLFKVDPDWFLSACTVQAVKYYGNNAAGKHYDNPISKTNRLYTIMHYTSLKEAYDRTLDFITNDMSLKDAIPADYTDSIAFINEDLSTTKLSDIIANKMKEMMGKTST